MTLRIGGVGERRGDIVLSDSRKLRRRFGDTRRIAASAGPPGFSAKPAAATPLLAAGAVLPGAAEAEHAGAARRPTRQTLRGQRRWTVTTPGTRSGVDSPTTALGRAGSISAGPRAVSGAKILMGRAWYIGPFFQAAQRLPLRRLVSVLRSPSVPLTPAATLVRKPATPGLTG